MDHRRMTMEPPPAHGGAYTQIRVTGAVVTTPSVGDVRRLQAVLSFWHGGPVEVVLSVAGTNGDSCWAELWDDVMREVPAHHAEIRFEVRGITHAAPIGHER